MFFLISKLAWMVASPIVMLFGAACVGTLLVAIGSSRAGLPLLTLGCGGLLVTGIVPIGSMLLQPLENRFPQLPDNMPAPAGVVVLGGSTDQELALARGRVTIADAGDRMTEAVVLAHRFPQARIVFTGGSAAIGGSADSEAADARRLWTAMGVPDARIVTEGRSRNTDENVRFTKPLVGPRPDEAWLLVTSAYHMPRAVALFRANGWPVIPDPVDYKTRGTSRDLRPNLDFIGNWYRLSMGLHEWIGLLAYRMTGRTQTLLPPV